MPTCTICGESLAEGARCCNICGTSVDSAPMADELKPAGIPLTTSAGPAPVASADNKRQCPACGETYGEAYHDDFCMCGVELLEPGVSASVAPAAPAAPAASPPASSPPVAEYVPVAEPAPPEPPAPAEEPQDFYVPLPTGLDSNTPCLVLYGPDRQPLHYFALNKDAVLIGRLDAVSGTFPDVDLAECLDSATARKVSRRHALVMRSRQTKRFTIRPLAGNTGTQIEEDMVLPMQDYPLKPGTRIVLGGAVRMKFEMTT